MAACAAEQQRRDSKQLEQATNLLLGLTDQVRRMGEQRDDLELMLKAELLVQFGMLRAELGHRLDEVSDRITMLEGGEPWRVGAGPRP